MTAGSAGAASPAKPENGPGASAVSSAGPGPAGLSAGAWSASGPPGAPLIVLIHGARLSRRMWVSVLPELERDHRVVTLDLPGHGRLASVPFTLEAAADLVAEVIEDATAIDAGPAVMPGGPGPGALVVGHSLGGYVAVALAARHPDLVAGLVVCSATLDPSGEARWPTALAALAYRLVPGRAGGLIDLGLLRLRYGAAVATEVAAGGVWYRGAGHAVADLVGRPIGAWLAAYQGPVALVNGFGDVPMRVGERSFHRHAPSARRVVIRGAIHLVPLDRPRELAVVIRSMVSSGPAGRPGRRSAG